MTITGVSSIDGFPAHMTLYPDDHLSLMVLDWRGAPLAYDRAASD